MAVLLRSGSVISFTSHPRTVLEAVAALLDNS